MERWPESAAAYRRAITIQVRLTSDFPNIPDYWQSLGQNHCNLGNLLSDSNQLAEAEAAYRAAQAIQEKLAAEFPDMPAYSRDLARTNSNLGNMLENCHKPAAAEAAYRRAVELREKLVKDFPAAPDLRANLASTYLHALRRRVVFRDNRANHCVLAIDIGAYTTDFAFLRFDLDNEEKAPAIICQSWALGVERLDQAFLRRLPEAKSEYIARLDSRRREELKHAIYVDEAPYRLDREMTIGGAGSEMQVFRDCVRAFLQVHGHGRQTSPGQQLDRNGGRTASSGLEMMINREAGNGRILLGSDLMGHSFPSQILGRPRSLVSTHRSSYIPWSPDVRSG